MLLTDCDAELSLYQLLNQEILANPYPLYQRLRVTDPVHWDIFMQAWILTRYSDVVYALRTFSAARTPSPAALREMGLPEMSVIAELTNNQMLFLDPPTHTRLRRVTASAFSPTNISGVRELISRIADRLLRPVLDRGEFDAVADFAAILPGMVTTSLLGVPESDYTRLNRWAADFSETFGSFQYDPKRSPQIVASCREMRDYFKDCLREQKRFSHSGLVNSLLTAEVDGQSLSEDEIIGTCIVIMVGSLTTTANLISNGLLVLLRHPHELRSMCNNPALLPSAVEELLRYDSPVQHVGRIASEHTEMGGHCIRAGQAVIAVLAAANRDPARFRDPERLDLAREDNRHVSFGWGIHFCIGAFLARLEAQIALGALVALPGLELTTDRLVWRAHLGLRGLSALPVAFKT